MNRYGREFVDKNGTLPWRTEEIYKKLVDAFTQKSPYSRDNINSSRRLWPTTSPMPTSRSTPR